MLNNCVMFSVVVLPMLNNCAMFFCSSIYLFLIVLVVIFSVNLILGNPLVRFIELSMKSKEGYKLHVIIIIIRLKFFFLIYRLPLLLLCQFLL